MEHFFESPYVIKGLISVALLLVVMLLARFAISVSAHRNKKNDEAPYVIKYAAVIFLAVGLLLIWLDSVGPVLTALTIVAAGLTIVSKELILNFLGSFVIFWRELFAIGDRVQVGEHTGDVLEKGILYFTLLESGRTASTGHSTGRLIKVPNAHVLTLPVINATRGAGYVWNEIKVTVTLESARERCREVLVGLANEYTAKRNMDLDKVRASFARRKVYFDKLTPRAYVSVDNQCVVFTLRYVCSSRMVRESEDFIYTGLLDKLEPGVIELADNS